jgi:hypothetical protein
MQNQNIDAIVITPTIGNPGLEDAMNSIRRQSFSSILHLIVIDGEQYENSVYNIIKKVPSYQYKVITLPWNTGAEKFNGHRIFAALGYLINQKYVLFLDDDNWFDENHVSSLVALIEDKKLDWAYSMRKIFSSTKEFICLDNCESIGDWPPYSGMASLVDTSCYCLKKEVLLKSGHAWMVRYLGDRTFFDVVKKAFPRFKTSALYSLNYTISDSHMPNENFFLRGNRYMQEKYKHGVPWLKE